MYVYIYIYILVFFYMPVYLQMILDNELACDFLNSGHAFKCVTIGIR